MPKGGGHTIGGYVAVSKAPFGHNTQDIQQQQHTTVHSSTHHTLQHTTAHTAHSPTPADIHSTLPHWRYTAPNPDAVGGGGMIAKVPALA